ncbi:MAG: preprotein translocase subunit SecE [Bacilli bacterium]|jgi:preprotein translocase SecE subunit|nr:preprotein translocase subunit SecE [Bacilli bacterium]MDD2681700.1 preprotein translocase subunit SecE [Bacilli bacterium]MDD3121549.1 preprotein translocase subunit SecE [Bacilli bacterium]MDD4062820.1 preprotein translocase subunit SecE [Bacilli bacterium]MDD4482225.1 preprotein translocase subunit SecE [Bacilli bacterium]
MSQKAEIKEKKKNSALSIFSKEYKYEGLILLVLAIIAIVLGSLVLVGEYSSGESGLIVNEDIWLIGAYPALVAWILVGLGVIGVSLSVWPFFKPSIFEFKRVTWLTKGKLLANSITVLIFVLIMSLFFFGIDFILRYVISLIELIAGLF